VLALVLLVAACGNDSEPAAGAGRPESHRRMVALLAQVRQEAADTNPWVGEHRAKELEAMLATLGPESSPRARFVVAAELGMEELGLGRERAAIAHLEEAARVGVASDPVPGVWTTGRDSVNFCLGVAYLRLGETENCCASHTPDSCLAPIRGGGIHTETFGSTHAAEVLLEEVRSQPKGSYGYLQALWLLNVAHMTLGTYPDGVPAEFRIPPERFESAAPFPRFPNVAAELGLDTFSLAGGAVGEDFDGDGDIDLLVSTWDPAGPMRYFRNRGDGRFDDRTEEAGLRGLLGGLNMVQADYDNDGDADVLVLRGAWLERYGRHPNSLLRNDGGVFTDVTFPAGLAEVHYPTQTASWADYDNDGFVDVYIGNESTPELLAHGQLFHNNGDGTFTDVAVAAGVTNDRWAKGVIWGDYDGDRFPDLYVSNLTGWNRLYHNQGDGTFRDVAATAGVEGPEHSFPAWFWDHDNDGLLDLYVSAFSTDVAHEGAWMIGFPQSIELARLYRGDGKGGFVDQAKAAGLQRPMIPMAANFGDLDNDGFLDFYLGTGDPLIKNAVPNLMFWNRGGTSFVDVTTAGGFGQLQKGHAIVFADFDGDGDVDVFEQLGGAAPVDRYYDAFYRNPGFGNHWIKVQLVGTRTNRAGIGARIRVVLADRSIYRHVNSGATFGANPFLQTIGLGAATRIERLEVFWPTTGKTQTLDEVPIDATVRIVEDAAVGD